MFKKLRVGKQVRIKEYPFTTGEIVSVYTKRLGMFRYKNIYRVRYCNGQISEWLSQNDVKEV